MCQKSKSSKWPNRLVGTSTEVSKCAASGVSSGVTGGQWCTPLVCPYYPGSPVAACAWQGTAPAANWQCSAKQWDASLSSFVLARACWA